ncbi:hypothetical protein QYF61_007546 [Mycteria americana]|uniref:Uncharacterized protein n=1 Tax=Mycteria americana TaxID=33587 RepID=A0AAN7MTQ3_MYCAM|nr:hypothetical protein QYF61_007546 [Mycteria americana]
MIRWLENLTDEGRLKEFGLFSLKKIQGRCSYTEDGGTLFTRTPGDRTRHNRLNFFPGKFCLDIRKTVFTMKQLSIGIGCPENIFNTWNKKQLNNYSWPPKRITFNPMCLLINKGVTDAVGEDESDSCGEVVPIAMRDAGDAPSALGSSLESSVVQNFSQEMKMSNNSRRGTSTQATFPADEYPAVNDLVPYQKLNSKFKLFMVVPEAEDAVDTQVLFFALTPLVIVTPPPPAIPAKSFGNQNKRAGYWTLSNSPDLNEPLTAAQPPLLSKPHYSVEPHGKLDEEPATKMQESGTPDKRATRIQTKVLPTTPKPSYKDAEAQALYLSPQKAPARTATPLRRNKPAA